MSKAGPAAAQGAKKGVLSEGEAASLKRSLEFLADDAKRICSVNIQEPFTNLQDAVDRLFPFHVSGGRYRGMAKSACHENTWCMLSNA